MIDLHCHILPYVDDGAADWEESLALLEMQVQQGVTEICLTPHLREGMFETPDEKLFAKAAELEAARKQANISVRLHLSREYYYDSRFQELLAAGELIPMGKHRTVLVEFSYGTSYYILEQAVSQVRAAGYRPLIAHVERYADVRRNPLGAQRLVQLGAMLQLNAGAVLGRDGFSEKRTCKILLKNRLVFAVASDAHNSLNRVPNLEKCRKYLEKKFGWDYASELMQENPLSILR